MKIEIPSRLSDVELIAEVKRLARSERQITARLVAHLAEMDARRLHRAAGFPSLFAYCREVLELSEQSTYNRIEAARAARRFPAILDMLSEAALTLATVRLLAPHLTANNHEEAPAGRGAQGQAGGRGVVGPALPAAGRARVGAEGTSIDGDFAYAASRIERATAPHAW